EERGKLRSLAGARVGVHNFVYCDTRPISQGDFADRVEADRTRPGRARNISELPARSIRVGSQNSGQQQRSGTGRVRSGRGRASQVAGGGWLDGVGARDDIRDEYPRSGREAGIASPDADSGLIGSGLLLKRVGVTLSHARGDEARAAVEQ